MSNKYLEKVAGFLGMARQAGNFFKNVSGTRVAGIKAGMNAGPMTPKMNANFGKRLGAAQGLQTQARSTAMKVGGGAVAGLAAGQMFGNNN